MNVSELYFSLWSIWNDNIEQEDWYQSIIFLPFEWLLSFHMSILSSLVNVMGAIQKYFPPVLFAIFIIFRGNFLCLGY